MWCLAWQLWSIMRLQCFISWLCVASLTRLLFLQPRVKMAPVHAACVLLSLAPLLVLGVPPIWTQPEQVHLSYPGKCLNCFHQLHVFSFGDTIFRSVQQTSIQQVVWIADFQVFCTNHSVVWWLKALVHVSSWTCCSFATRSLKFRFTFSGFGI